MQGSISSTVGMQAVQWSSFKGRADFRNIDDSDATCLLEIREILYRHNCLSRFGVSVLNDEVELAEDEIILETTDESKREHWVRPVKRSALTAFGIETQATKLRFDNKGWNQYCSCARNIHGHTGTHRG